MCNIRTSTEVVANIDALLHRIKLLQERQSATNQAIHDYLRLADSPDEAESSVYFLGLHIRRKEIEAQLQDLYRAVKRDAALL